MKKILILICLIFLTGCSLLPRPEAAPAAPVPAAGEDLQAQLTEKNRMISDLEYQILELSDSLASLQSDYDELQAASTSAEPITDSVICDVDFGSMKYQNATSAIAIVEGWFALQDHVRELQGTYSTTFWTGVESRIHTIRYINANTGLSTTTSFLIFFEEAEWNEGLLWMTEQCWLDFPH